MSSSNGASGDDLHINSGIGSSVSGGDLFVSASAGSASKAGSANVVAGASTSGLIKRGDITIAGGSGLSCPAAGGAVQL